MLEETRPKGAQRAASSSKGLHHEMRPLKLGAHPLEMMHIHFTTRSCAWIKMSDLDWWFSDVFTILFFPYVRCVLNWLAFQIQVVCIANAYTWIIPCLCSQILLSSLVFVNVPNYADPYSSNTYLVVSWILMYPSHHLRFSHCFVTFSLGWQKW